MVYNYFSYVKLSYLESNEIIRVLYESINIKFRTFLSWTYSFPEYHIFMIYRSRYSNGIYNWWCCTSVIHLIRYKKRSLEKEHTYFEKCPFSSFPQFMEHIWCTTEKSALKSIGLLTSESKTFKFRIQLYKE